MNKNKNYKITEENVIKSIMQKKLNNKIMKHDDNDNDKNYIITENL